MLIGQDMLIANMLISRFYYSVVSKNIVKELEFSI
jgi:hypothetical protein